MVDRLGWRGPLPTSIKMPHHMDAPHSFFPIQWIPFILTQNATPLNLAYKKQFDEFDLNFESDTSTIIFSYILGE